MEYIQFDDPLHKLPVRIYDGTEHFMIGEKKLPFTVTDYWKWAYSDMTSNLGRAAVAEYLVVTALGVQDKHSEQMRRTWRPYDVETKDGIRVEIKSSSNMQAHRPDLVKSPRFVFSIAPARVPDDTGDYKRLSPRMHNSQVYVFCIFMAETKESSPLDISLWRFFVSPTAIFRDKMKDQKTISLKSLLKIGTIECDYYGIEDAVHQAYERGQSWNTQNTK